MSAQNANMEHKWEEITSDLYSKIKPVSGALLSQIDRSFISRKNIEIISLEFEMNDFIYLDPFYGEQKSTAPFKMCVELQDYMAPLKLSSILEIENLLIEGGTNDRIGAFSNSLHFTMPKLEFGKIDNFKVDVKIEYCLTNSDSYGMMTGGINDHIRKSGIIETSLEIKELQVILPNEMKPLDITKFLNRDVYNLNEIRLATDLAWSSVNYKRYNVPYGKGNDNEDLRSDLISKKWWQMWK